MRIAPRIKHRVATFIVSASLWACWLKFFALPTWVAASVPVNQRSIGEWLLNLLSGTAWTAYVVGSGVLFIFAHQRVTLWRRAFEDEHGFEGEVFVGSRLNPPTANTE